MPLREIELAGYIGLLNPPLLTGNTSYAVHDVNDNFSDNELSFGEQQTVLCKVKIKKAPGFSRVPYEFFKTASDVLLNKMLYICNNISKSDVIPGSFKRTIVFPSHKKGDTD